MNFTASGESSNFDSIRVTNLASGAQIKLYNNDVLHLYKNSTNIPINSFYSNKLICFPNPAKEFVKFKINSKLKQNVQISIINEVGNIILNNLYDINEGPNLGEIRNLKSGFYTIEIITKEGKFIDSFILSNNLINSNPSINLIFENQNDVSLLKELNYEGQMEYNDNEVLLISAYSQNMNYIKTIRVSQNMTFNANFTSCVDNDNNYYPVVEINGVYWMGKNLKTSKLNDGTVIPNVTGNTEWSSLSTMAYCTYLNSSSYGNIYGFLYNEFAVNSQKLCPLGWHVSSKSDWDALIAYCGDSSAIKLREQGNQYWESVTSAKATNEFGFSAVGGAWRVYNGNFSNVLNEYALFWSPSTSLDSKYVQINCFNKDVYQSSYTYTNGYSVRCVKD